MGRQLSEDLPYLEQEGGMEISGAMENDAVAPTITKWIGQASKELEKVVFKNVEVAIKICTAEELKSPSSKTKRIHIKEQVKEMQESTGSLTEVIVFPSDLDFTKLESSSTATMDIGLYQELRKSFEPSEESRTTWELS